MKHILIFFTLCAVFVNAAETPLTSSISEAKIVSTPNATSAEPILPPEITLESDTDIDMTPAQEKLFEESPAVNIEALLPEEELKGSQASMQEPIIDITTIEKPKPVQKKAFLQEYLKPWEFGDPNELIEFQFENAELLSVVQYFEKQYNLTFIYDDLVNPSPQGGKRIGGTKISFRTHQPLTKRDAWNLFVTFLDIAGLAPQPGPQPRVYRFSPTDPRSPLSVTRGPIPTFIGTDPAQLPMNDSRIRYVYFVENTSLEVIKNVIESFKSSTAPGIVIFTDLRAVIITDKASTVKALVEVIKELDRVNMPESMIAIRLKNTDATKIAELYRSLAKDETQTNLATRLLGGRKPQTTMYFDETVRVVPEPRTNTLFFFGNKHSLKKIEDFIRTKIDKGIDAPFSPLHVYKLKYVAAETMANILREAVQFQAESEAAKFGGVREGDKYFKPMTITPEKMGNRLIINAEYEDYLKIYELLQKIDIEQPQVAIKVLILDVNLIDEREFGIQMRDKVPGPNGLLGDNVTFQTSGLAGTGQGVVENRNGDGATRLLGDLVNLATTTVNPGSTFLTLGSDAFGVWGMLKVLQTFAKVAVIANPFGVVVNKYPLIVSLGETRRIVTGTALTATGPIDSFDDLTAKLEIYIEPQISYDGYITLNNRVTIESFTNTLDQANGNRTIKEVKSSVLLANNETVALGGLMRDLIVENETKVPILGDIPLAGWLFKNKTKQYAKSSLLILITPEIIPSNDVGHVAQNFTQFRMNEVKNELISMNASMDQFKDPIHRWFFGDHLDKENLIIDEFSLNQNRYIDVEPDSDINPLSTPEERVANAQIEEAITNVPLEPLESVS